MRVSVEFSYKRTLTIRGGAAKSMRKLGIPAVVCFLLCIDRTVRATGAHMTKIKMSFLALLLAPAVTFATTVTVDWSGQIDAYGAVGSVYPQTLSDTSISGVFTFDTNLLPPPDAGNPPGVVSFTGSGFLQSSVQWSGGPFAAEPPGSSGSNSLYIDTTQNPDLVSIQDGSTYIDAVGTLHEALLNLNITGLLAANSPGSTSAISGNGFFEDVTVPSDNSDPQGFQAVYEADSISVHVQPVSVPEPDTASLSVGMLLAVMVAWRGRRRQVRLIEGGLRATTRRSAG